jgi:S-methylmethionine-dependent homocysteine/selenocysteine methylase
MQKKPMTLTPNLNNQRPLNSYSLRDEPDFIFALHEAALRAGSDVLLTASRDVSLAGLMRAGMYLREARETIFSSVMLACMAREKFRAESTDSAAKERKILIGGSIGPARTEKYGEYYEPKIEALLSPRKNYRIDFLSFENVVAVDEVLYILAFMKKFPAARLTFSFENSEQLLGLSSILERDKQVTAIRTGVGPFEWKR